MKSKDTTTTTRDDVILALYHRPAATLREILDRIDDKEFKMRHLVTMMTNLRGDGLVGFRTCTTPAEFYVTAKGQELAKTLLPQPTGQFYIASLKWTNGKDHAVWFGPDNGGYVYELERAGTYTREQVEGNKRHYDDGEDTIAVPVEKARQLAKMMVSASAVFDLWRERQETNDARNK